MIITDAPPVRFVVGTCTRGEYLGQKQGISIFESNEGSDGVT